MLVVLIFSFKFSFYKKIKKTFFLEENLKIYRYMYIFVFENKELAFFYAQMEQKAK